MVQTGQIAAQLGILAEEIAGAGAAIDGADPVEAAAQGHILALDVIPGAVLLHPLVTLPVAGEAVLVALGGLDDLTLHTSVVDEVVLVVLNGDPTLACAHSGIGIGAEVIVVAFAALLHHGLPALLQDTGQSVLDAAALFDEAGVQALALTVFIEQVILLHGLVFGGGQVLQTGNGLVVHIVEVAADPTVAVGLVQDEGIFKADVLGFEVGAGLLLATHDHIGVDEGQQAVFFLVVGAAGEAVQRRGPQIDAVSDLTGIADDQLLVLVPGSAVLQAHLNAAEDAGAADGSRINGLGTVHPLGSDGQLVVLIQHGAVHVEQIAGDLQAAQVHLHIGAELGDDLDLRQNADTLGQAQQEFPGAEALIRAGQHVGDVLQLLGDLKGGHIQGEGVIHIHTIAGLHDLIEQVVLGLGVVDLTEPCQGTVTGSGFFKIEVGFAGGVKGNAHLGEVLVAVEDDVDGHGADSVVLQHRQDRAVKPGDVVILREEEHIVGIVGHGVTLEGDLQGDLRGDAHDDVHGVLGEGHHVRQDHIQLLAANGDTVDHQADLHLAVIQSGEGAVLADGANIGIGNLPSSAGGNGSGVAGVADAGGSQLQLGTHGQVVEIGSNIGVVKFLGGLCGGHRHQGGGHAAGVTVGGTADQLQLIAAGGLGQIGGRTAAVQVHRVDTACVQHDLRDLFHAAAGGEGLLTAVQDHHDHLALGSDAHSRAAGPGGGVVGALLDDDLTVSDQGGAEAADGILDLGLVLGVLSLGADHGGAVLQDGEEAVAVHGVPLHAVHHQQAAGLTGGHIVAVAVGGNDDVEMLVFILVVVQQGVGLILHPLHAPAAAGVVVLVVGHDGHIITVDIHSGNIVDDLLAIRSGGVVDGLADAGSQNGLHRGEDGVVGAFLFLFAAAALQPALCQLVKVIGKGVAAGSPQVVGVGQTAVSLQHLQAHIGGICTQDRRTDILLIVQTLEAGVQEVGCPVGVRQGGGEVAFHQSAELLAAALELGDQVEGIQVGIEVVHAEGLIGIHTKAVGADIISHLLHGAGGDITIVLAEVQQVTQVTGPAAQVSGGSGCDIGNVHGAEHVTKVGPVAVGQIEIINDDIPQVHGIGAVDGILLLHIGGKTYDLFAGKGFPVAVVVPFHAGTDKIDGQFACILAGDRRVFIRIALQHLQGAEECRILGHAAGSQGRHGHQAYDHNDRKDQGQPSGCLGCSHDNSISFSLHGQGRADHTIPWRLGQNGYTPPIPIDSYAIILYHVPFLNAIEKEKNSAKLSALFFIFLTKLVNSGLSPYHFVHDSRVGLNDAHHLGGNIFLHIIRHRNAPVTAAVHLHRRVHRLQQ